MKKYVCCLAVFLVLPSIILVSGCGTAKMAVKASFPKITWIDTGGKVSDYRAQAIAFDSENDLLYAGFEEEVDRTGATEGRGVWKYDGNKWTDTGGDISNYYIASLAYDSTHNLLYAGCYKESPGEVSSREPHGTGVWKYNGKTWTSTGSSVKSFNVVSLAYDSAHNVLYAACQYTPSTDGVWKYDGKSWTDLGASSYGIVSLAYDGKHNLLYAGTIGGVGVWKYTGTEWINTGGGVSGFWVNCLAYDSARNLLYAGTGAGVEDINHFGHGVWKYDGTNWTDIGGAFSKYSVNSLACDSAHNMTYASYYFNDVSVDSWGHKGVCKYDGTTWTNISDKATSNYNFRSLVYDSRSNLLYAGCSDELITGKGVWKYKER